MLYKELSRQLGDYILILSVAQVNRFTQCDMCNLLQEEIRTTHQREHRQQLNLVMKEHIDLQS